MESVLAFQLQQTHCSIAMKSFNLFVSCHYLLTAELNLVLMIPGAIQLTLMLSDASSSERTFVRPNKAVLLTE